MKRYVLLFILLLSFAAFSQEKDLHLQFDGYRMETSYLNEDISMPVLAFEDSRQDDAFGMLPVYMYRFRLNSPDVSITAVIIEEHTDIFEHEALTNLADADKIRDDFQLLTSIVYLDAVPYAEVLILPFRNLAQSSLSILDSCQVHIEVLDTEPTMRKQSAFAENSVLATGSWYRIATEKTGMYRITHDDLAAMGISPASIDPRKLRIFGNGNGIVPEKNSDERYDDLIENAIYVHGEADGTFNEDDYVLFYGQSSINWEYVPFQGYGLFLHEVNPYTDRSYYFLNIDDSPGKRVQTIEYPGLTPTVSITEFSDYAMHENDTVNILKTGREWYGELYSEIISYDYSFNFPNIVKEYPVSLRTNVAAHSTIESKFDYYYGEQHLLEAPVSKIIIGTTVYAWTTTPDTIAFYPIQGDMVTIRVDYDKPVSSSLGWMNYISVNARRKLIFDGPYMAFRDHLSSDSGEVVQYELSGFDSQPFVWDVTDPFNITLQAGEYEESDYTFVAPAEVIREFIAFDGSGYESVEFIEEVKNQNLHSYEAVEYIILSHPDFIEQSQRMLYLHQVLDNMSGFIVTPQEIYNEFSSGKQDPAGIRDFVRMLYEEADSMNKPKYLLLMGDASYDYKERLTGNTNYVPAYQSLEALKLGYSFVTDDFFGLMDPGEGVNAWGKSVEIGIGRFPVHTVEQAEDMVDKVEAYLTLNPQMLAPWRNDIYFIGDYGDQNLHFTQAEKLQTMVDTGHHVYNRKKIYVDAYPLETSSSGNRYPEVNTSIDRMMGYGSLIVNYTGHGGEAGWSKASILNIPMINTWNNWNRLPLFITATCEFSRYDDPSLISAGELVFLNPAGGGIGLLTTSRLAWADPNFRLNKAVYKYMFERPNGEHYRIGDIVKLSKTDQNNGTNIKNFVLLGDPAMRIAYPQNNIITTSVNGAETTVFADTLSAMEQGNVRGVLTSYTGDTLSDFNGIIYVKVFDQDKNLSTLGSGASSIPAQFYAQGQLLHDGKATIINGQFSCDFFMPKTMSANIGPAKISYYAYDTVNMRDGFGYLNIKTGGVNPEAAPDNEGPEMKLYINNTNFISGDLTDSDPVFLAYMYDEHGINFTGNGIGRDITLTLDNDPNTTVVVNDLFDSDMDSYQSGWLSYPYYGLRDGMHTLTLKAYDNMDNLTESSIEFEVSVYAPLSLTGVMNYPNPFSDVTYFVFDHNKPGNSFDVEIQIYSINGQLVESLRANSSADGLSISPLSWDGTDSGGNKLGTGIYVYRLFVTDEQGTLFVQTSKLILAGGN